MKRLWAPALPVLCLACHTYSAVAVNGITRGNEVVLHLTELGATQLASSIGPQASEIDGTITTLDSTGLRMAVREVVRTNGESNFLRGESILVPTNAVATAQIRKLAVGRSALIAAAMVTGLALIGRSGGSDGVSSTPGGPPVVPQ